MSIRNEMGLVLSSASSRVPATPPT